MKGYDNSDIIWLPAPSLLSIKLGRYVTGDAFIIDCNMSRTVVEGRKPAPHSCGFTFQNFLQTHKTLSLFTNHLTLYRFETVYGKNQIMTQVRKLCSDKVITQA